MANDTNGTAVAAKLRPLADRLVVKPATREETTKSGIVLPDTAKEKPQRGTVLAVGEGRRDEDGDRIPMDVQAGDAVLFAKYAGTELKLEDEDLLILSEKDVLAVVTD
ncbi:MAG: co-chaperone GroES [Chloroflexota bacterium]|nr:co-chaperone GroES [Chloroflexota bacterium]